MKNLIWSTCHLMLKAGKGEGAEMKTVTLFSMKKILEVIGNLAVASLSLRFV